jgi:glutathione S-transferase
VGQSSALIRWAGKKSGLYPADPDQAVFCDEIMDSLAELKSKVPRPTDKEQVRYL